MFDRAGVVDARSRESNGFADLRRSARNSESRWTPAPLSARILAMLRPPTIAGVLLVLVVLGSACSSTPNSTATTSHQATGVFTADSTVTGPITTGHIVEPLTGLNQNMPAYGYEEQEFFVSGTAHAFRSTSTPANGQWTITPTTSAPYETRILVRRPSDREQVQRDCRGRVAERVRRRVVT